MCAPCGVTCVICERAINTDVWQAMVARAIESQKLASLARAHERVRVQKVRDFSQTKLDSEINAPLL